MTLDQDTATAQQQQAVHTFDWLDPATGQVLGSCTVHGARCTVHGARCTVHGAEQVRAAVVRTREAALWWQAQG